MKHLYLFETFHQPTTQVKMKLKSIVDKLLSQYGGGKQFFNALDDQIKNLSNQDLILNLVKGCENDYIATSGGFGNLLLKLWQEGKFECKGLVVFNGRMMTDNIGVLSWFPPDFDFNNKEFVYIDDSYFSGTTAKKIDEFLLTKKAKISRIAVIYDGSKLKSPMVDSFFRYYDSINESFSTGEYYTKLDNSDARSQVLRQQARTGNLKRISNKDRETMISKYPQLKRPDRRRIFSHRAEDDIGNFVGLNPNKYTYKINKNVSYEQLYNSGYEPTEIDKTLKYIDFEIMEASDEWFFVKIYFKTFGLETHKELYECDQIDGVLKLIEDKVINNRDYIYQLEK